MTLDRRAVFLHFSQQMRSVRRRNSLRRKMAADVQVSRILFLLDGLVMAARVCGGSDRGEGEDDQERAHGGCLQ